MRTLLPLLSTGPRTRHVESIMRRITFPQAKRICKEFADLVRLAASTEMELNEFQKQYFSLMHKNCLPKLKRRINDLRESLSPGKPIRDKDNNLIFTESDWDQLRALLQKAIDSNDPQPRYRNRADKDALEIVTDTKNIFVALLQVLDSMKSVDLR